MNQEQIIDAVEKMTVLELNTFIKAIEEKWGVSATPTMTVGVPTASVGTETTPTSTESGDGTPTASVGAEASSIAEPEASKEAPVSEATAESPAQ